MSQNKIFLRFSKHLMSHSVKATQFINIDIAISAYQPQFIDLADIWMGLQDEVIILSNVNNFLWELQSLSNKVTVHSTISIPAYLRNILH